jgi:hypothetical protein
MANTDESIVHINPAIMHEISCPMLILGYGYRNQGTDQMGRLDVC